MNKPVQTLTLLTLLFAANVALAQAHAQTHVVAHDYSFTSPKKLETGYVTLQFTNDGRELHHLQLARLQEGVSLEKFTAALKQGEQAALPLIEFVGGVGLVPPGGHASTTVYLEKPGTYVELCFVPDANGVPHLALGMLQPVTVVVSSDPSQAEAPEADLVVDMKDFSYLMAARVTAGKQVWQVINQGPQPHEMIVGKLQKGKTMDDVMAYLQNGSQGLPPIELMGGAQAIAAGQSSFINLDLKPGQYVAICFIPDPASGKPHVALGMLSPFTVTTAVASR